MSSVLIIGGHGKVALRLAPILTSRGDAVTSIIRNPEHTDDVSRTGATARVADVSSLDEESLVDLFRGHDAIVWSAGAGGGDPERTYAVDRDAAIRSMSAAAAAGVSRYVMVSYIGSRRDHGVAQDDPFFAYAEAKSIADEHLRGTDLEWTILAPGPLTLEEPTGLISVDGSRRRPCHARRCRRRRGRDARGSVDDPPHDSVRQRRDADRRGDPRLSAARSASRGRVP